MSFSPFTPTEASVIRARIASLPPSGALALINTMELHLTERLCFLETMRNEFTFISTLPPETLAEILVLAVQPGADPKLDDDYSPIPWAAHVQLSSVCRAWREVTLGCAAFWAGIPLLACKELPNMMARAKDHPLDVRINLGHVSHSGQEEMRNSIQAQLGVSFLPVANRLALFHFTSSDHLPERLRMRWPEGKAPLLHSLKLSFSFLRDEPVEVPWQLLTNSKRALRHLTLQSCSIDWAALIANSSHKNAGTCDITNLTTLCLRHVRPPPPQELLINILRRSPDLQLLEVESSLPHNFVFVNQEDGILSLPSLRQLCIRSRQASSNDLTQCANILMGLQVPADARIIFEYAPGIVDFVPAHTAIVADLVRHCRLITRSRGSPTWKHMRIEQAGSRLTCAVSRYPALPLSVPPNAVRVERPNSTVDEFEDTVRVKIPAQGFFAMHDLLHVPTIESFHLKWTFELQVDGLGNVHIPEGLDGALDTGRWRSFFRRHPSIQYIRLTTPTYGSRGPGLEANIDTFLAALRPSTEKTPTVKPQSTSLGDVPIPSRTTSKSCPLPHLQTLHFEDAPLSKEQLDLLELIVIEREWEGHPLDVVDFERCRDMTVNDVFALRDRVEGVTNFRIIGVDEFVDFGATLD